MKGEIRGMKAHFVLIHGISGGGWCWYKIKCLLENSGYKVFCIDLKCSGIDPSDANQILSFEDYNKPLMDLMSALPENDQVTQIYKPFKSSSLVIVIFKLQRKFMYIEKKIFVCHQVILVGHSAGGLSVTAATHKFAKKISVAIYVAATMLQQGYMTPQDLTDVSFFLFNYIRILDHLVNKLK